MSQAILNKQLKKRIIAAGCRLRALTQLQQEGVTAKSIRELNDCSLGRLKAAGVSVIQLYHAGFDVDELLQANISLADLRLAGISARTLKSRGFSKSQLLAAGFSEAELTGFDSFAAASEAVSYLAEDTAFDAHERHLAEQAELRRRFKSKVHTREKSFDAPAAGETMQNGLAQHPWLANQRFDGIDPNLNPEPPLNSEARREFDNAKREQEMEKQLRLGNMPAFSSSPKPKPS